MEMYWKHLIDTSFLCKQKLFLHEIKKPITAYAVIGVQA